MGQTYFVWVKWQNGKRLLCVGQIAKWETITLCGSNYKMGQDYFVWVKFTYSFSEQTTESKENF